MANVSYGLEDKVAVVTGGTRGIGLAVARQLLGEKARVVVCGRKPEGLENALRELDGGDRLNAIQAHVAREDNVSALFDEVVRLHGRVDILINNVGMNLLTASTAETDLSVWQKIMDTNLNGTFLCSRRAASIMKEGGGGKIVTISSIAGRRAAPGMGIYGVAKAGLDMLTKVLASELAPFNIQVNAVAPGMVKTDFSKLFWSNQELHDQIVQGIPIKRLADPEDVVHPTLFLASKAADYITGQVLCVDGGASAV